MWRPYLTVIAEKTAGSVNILDRLHIMRHMSKTIEEVRSNLAKEPKSKGR